MRKTASPSSFIGFLIALIFLTAGCDKQVKRDVVSTLTVSRRVDCDKFDYCYKCSIGFDGNFNCGYKFSAFCPGEQDAQIKVIKERVFYQSGKTRDVVREVITDRFGSCR